MKLSTLPVALAALSGMLQIGLCLPGNDDATSAQPRMKAAQPQHIVEGPREDRVEAPEVDGAPKFNFGHFRQLRQRLLEEKRQKEREAEAEEAAGVRPETRRPEDYIPKEDTIPDEDIPKEVSIPEESPVPEGNPVHVPEGTPGDSSSEETSSEGDSSTLTKIDYNGKDKQDQATQTSQEQAARLYILKEEARLADTSNGEDERPPIGWLLPARLRDPGYISSIKAKAYDLIVSSGSNIARAIFDKGYDVIEEAVPRIQQAATIDEVMNCLREVDIVFDTFLEVYSMATYNIIQQHRLNLRPFQKRIQDNAKEVYGIYLGWVNTEVVHNIKRLLEARLNDLENIPQASQVEMIITGLERYVSFIETMAGLFTLRDLYVFPLQAPEGIDNPQGLAGLLLSEDYPRIVDQLEKSALDASEGFDKAKQVLKAKPGFQRWNQHDYDLARAKLRTISHTAELNSEDARTLQQARALFRTSWAMTDDFFFYRALKKFRKIAKYEALLPTYTSFKDPGRAIGAWGIIVHRTEKEAILFTQVQNDFDLQLLRVPGGEELLRNIYKDHDEVLF